MEMVTDERTATTILLQTTILGPISIVARTLDATRLTDADVDALIARDACHEELPVMVIDINRTHQNFLLIESQSTHPVAKISDMNSHMVCRRGQTNSRVNVVLCVNISRMSWVCRLNHTYTDR